MQEVPTEPEEMTLSEWLLDISHQGSPNEDRHTSAWPRIPSQKTRPLQARLTSPTQTQSSHGRAHLQHLLLHPFLTIQRPPSSPAVTPWLSSRSSTSLPSRLLLSLPLALIHSPHGGLKSTNQILSLSCFSALRASPPSTPHSSPNKTHLCWGLPLPPSLSWRAIFLLVCKHIRLTPHLSGLGLVISATLECHFFSD